METFFNRPLAEDSDEGIIYPSHWYRLQEKIQKDFIELTHYIREESFAVDNRHLLVRIIRDLNVTPEQDALNFRHEVNERAHGIAQAHNIITSRRSSRKVVNSHFYGEDDQELYIHTQGDLTFSQLEKNWPYLQPIRVLRHPRTDLSMTMLDQINSTEKGLCVIQIDIVKLAMQYYYWYHSQPKDRTFKLTSRHFVYAYPMLNLLMSHIDVALFNRLFAQIKGRSVQETYHALPIHIRDHDRAVDRYIEDRISSLFKRDERYITRLYQIAVPFHGTLRKLVRLPDMMLNRKNRWAIALARMDLFHFLIYMDHETGGSRNRKEENEIHRRIVNYQNDQGLKSSVPDVIYNQLLQELDQKLEIYLT